MTWYTVIRRCYVPTERTYKTYGARGIKVCDRWRDKESGFNNFLADMGPRPVGAKITRRDYDGDYTPENCYWEQLSKLHKKRRSIRTLTCDGITKTIAEWAKQLGCSIRFLCERKKRGWTDEETIKVPLPVQDDPQTKKFKLKIRDILHYAVRKGHVTKPSSCEFVDCHETEVTAHHHKGYSEEHALDVQWLCRKHHEHVEHEAQRKSQK